MVTTLVIDGRHDLRSCMPDRDVAEDWQAEQWGEDTLATQAQEARRAEFDAGVRFLGLV